MPSDSFPRLALRYAQAVPVLMTACGVDPSARTSFEARIRQLQRLGVPGRSGDRSSGRLDYGLVELASLATAIRLMAAFMVPSLAARYVTERWDVLAPAVLAGARSALPASYLDRRPLDGATIVFLEAAALADLGRQGPHDERYTGQLGALVAADPAELTDAMAPFGSTGLVMDTASYMPAVVDGFRDAVSAADQELAHELDRLRFSV